MNGLSRLEQDNLLEATAEYHAKMAPLTGVPWRQGRSNPCNLYAVTGDDWKGHVPIGQLATPELAGAACAAHNDMLRLRWLLGAGHDVQIGVHDHSGGPAFCVRLPGDETSDLAAFRGCGSLGEGLAQAVEWSEREGITP
jgi:hypothetical protein